MCVILACGNIISLSLVNMLHMKSVVVVVVAFVSLVRRHFILLLSHRMWMSSHCWSLLVPM